MSPKLGFILFVLGVGLVESRAKHQWGKLTADKIEQFKKAHPRTNVDRFVSALDRMNERMATKEPTAEKKLNLAEMIKGLKNHKRSPRHHKEGDSLSQINTNAGIANSLYGGDMVLSDPQVDVILGDFLDDSETGRDKRQAHYSANYPTDLWGNTFYYYFDASLSAKAKKAAQMAIAFWQNSTCVDFVESQTNPNRVRFLRDDDGCYSDVGMLGGVQVLSLGTGCEYFYIAAHEIAHALGFFHEQERYDRDTAITVNSGNVIPAQRFNYEKLTTSNNNNYLMPYDYGSVMQYDELAFTSNNGRTMFAKRAAYQNTMGSALISFYDISMMNSYYKCKAKCPNGVTCVNGGFRNSRNCNVCICPSGWGGITCSERESGCGAALIAKGPIQTQSITIGANNEFDTEYETFEKCNYIIRAPMGYKIEVILKTITGIDCTPGCVYKGIEVKAMSDHRYTGIRYCCEEDIGTKIVSEGNVMPSMGPSIPRMGIS
ncbi:unnamed protein product, partial [Mesorhabditis belari]|uniref:Zinc metalloproteinase n=1 Tax=Mesorhabditis belari TaxID=2138241 RepID=A0AAF3EBY9_9BILA